MRQLSTSTPTEAQLPDLWHKPKPFPYLSLFAKVLSLEERVMQRLSAGLP